MNIFFESTFYWISFAKTWKKRDRVNEKSGRLTQIFEYKFFLFILFSQMLHFEVYIKLKSSFKVIE